MGKTAFITGAGDGIGRAIAHRLAQDGFNIVINDVIEEKLVKVEKEIKDLGAECVRFVGDVSDQQAVFNMVDQAVDRFGQLDVMVANAGITQVKPLEEVTPQDLEKIFSINVYGVLYCTQAAAKHMKLKKSGKIINASSTSGKRAVELLGHYAATKFGVIGLTQAAAKELAPFGITCNCYCPGIVDTNMWVDIDEKISNYTGKPKGETYNEKVKNIPLGRAEKPEDVANLVSYLASKDSDYMTGQSLVIDGGTVFN